MTDNSEAKIVFPRFLTQCAVLGVLDIGFWGSLA